MYDLSLFIFNKDLRLDDNTALIDTLKNSKTVIPCVIFDKKQRDPYDNGYYNNFYLDCVHELDHSLKSIKGPNKTTSYQLYCFFGDTIKVIEDLIAYFRSKRRPIGNIALNEVYTFDDYNIEQDILNICDSHLIRFNSYNDRTYNTLKDCINKHREFPNTYSEYLRLANVRNKGKKMTKSKKNKYTNYLSSRGELNLESQIDYKKYLVKRSRTSLYNIIKTILNNNGNSNHLRGGRPFGLLLMKQLRKNKDDNIIYRLMPYLTYGSLSIRDVNDYMGKQINMNDIYHRDYVIINGHYKSYIFNHSRKYTNDPNFQKWVKGNTGIPFVDAFMRQLKTEGTMEPFNLGMDIVLSCYINYLKLDKISAINYFNNVLIGSEPAMNIYRWNNFKKNVNPFTMSKRHDKGCAFIKKWIPELKDISCDFIYKWNEKGPSITGNNRKTSYPNPIVNTSTTLLKKIITVGSGSGSNSSEEKSIYDKLNVKKNTAKIYVKKKTVSKIQPKKLKKKKNVHIQFKDELVSSIKIIED